MFSLNCKGLYNVGMDLWRPLNRPILSRKVQNSPFVNFYSAGRLLSSGRLPHLSLATQNRFWSIQTIRTVSAARVLT